MVPDNNANLQNPVRRHEFRLLFSTLSGNYYLAENMLHCIAVSNLELEVKSCN